MNLPEGCRLSIEESPALGDRKALANGLHAFNARHFENYAPLRVGFFIRGDTGEVRAGLDAYLSAGWLYIDNLWVDDALRGRGIGRALMRKAEDEAAARGCHSAWVDTFSFQAPDFYRKLGYEMFATLDYPPQHRRHFFRKKLAPALNAQ